jgi:tripartite-type tricarboxylate transporter receptor subunit TctC
VQNVKVLGAVAFLSLFVGSPHGLQAQTNFYQGKTITIIVGTVPGGLYDQWGRLFARVMGKYIPGNPSMVVQNMPGGGSMIAANYIIWCGQTRRPHHRDVSNAYVPAADGSAPGGQI